MDELIKECEKEYGQENYSRLDWLCNQILEQDRMNETALTYHLYIFCKWSQHHLVFRTAEEIHNAYPDNYHAYNAKAMAHLAKGEFQKALDCCEEGLKIKDYHWLRMNKIEALISLNRIDEAYEFHNSGEIPDYNFTKALINCGKYGEINEYKDDLSDEEIVEYLLERCFDLDDKGDYKEVVRACDEIFKVEGDNEEALIYKAIALAHLERNDELLEICDYGIRSYPKISLFYFLKAETAYYDLKKLDEAIELYEKGLSLSSNPNSHWGRISDLTYALNDKADQLIESGNYREAVQTYDKILFYKPEEFDALDKINTLTKEHEIDYKHTEHYNESARLRCESQRRIKRIDDFLERIVIGQYDEDYVRGCSEFKDYNSFEEYVRDVIICLMESYPKRSEEHSRFLVKCNIEYVKSSYEYREPADYCVIEVGYCCG